MHFVAIHVSNAFHVHSRLTWEKFELAYNVFVLKMSVKFLNWYIPVSTYKVVTVKCTLMKHMWSLHMFVLHCPASSSLRPFYDVNNAEEEAENVASVLKWPRSNGLRRGSPRAPSSSSSRGRSWPRPSCCSKIKTLFSPFSALRRFWRRLLRRFFSGGRLMSVSWSCSCPRRPLLSPSSICFTWPRTNSTSSPRRSKAEKRDRRRFLTTSIFRLKL